MYRAYGDSDRDLDDGFSLMVVLRTIAPLRIGAGVVLFLQYALEGTLRAWHFIWNHAPWPFVAALERGGIPYPFIAAPAAAFIAMAVAIAWTFGFFTRLFSILFLPVLAGALIQTHHLHDESTETACWLFVFIAFTLILHGSGSLSLDRLFSLAAKPKRTGGKLL